MSARQRFGHLIADELTAEHGMSVVGGLVVDGASLWSMLDRGARVFYQDPVAGGASNVGTRDAPVLTMTQALALCESGRGDVIMRMRGGESVTSTTEFNVAGVTIQAVDAGLNPLFRGEYFSMYADAGFTDGPVAKITERCAISGLGFASRDAGATFFSGAALLIGGDADATPFGVHLLGCRFPKWNFTNRIGLAIEGSSDVLIEECSFEGVGAAFTSGIYVQGATQNLEVRNNRFRQCTHAITHGAFAGGGPHCVYKGNVVEDGKLLNSDSKTATGIITDNFLETAVGTGSFDVNYATLAGLGLYCSGNHYVETD
ncbi:MAG: right-handed parallel beta-helix repeat-containing protein [Zetaproteobacteria bacterium]|nr:right-handed parallel beta-helix repeat-containing protein [Zetaproteobacteria bacterium]